MEMLPISSRDKKTTMEQSLAIIHSSSTIRKILAISAQRAGWQPNSYATIDEAQSAFAQSIKPCRLIILDTSYPKVEYGNVIHTFKELMPQADIVLCLSRDRVLDRLRSKLSGARSILVEPLKMAAFQQLLNSVR